MTEKQEHKVIIDIDKAIQLFNSKNPHEPINRKILAEKLNLSYQSLVNYQSGFTPAFAMTAKQIIDLTGITFCELVIEEKYRDSNDPIHESKVVYELYNSCKWLRSARTVYRR